jgi:hypothetical protein
VALGHLSRNAMISATRILVASALAGAGIAATAALPAAAQTPACSDRNDVELMMDDSQSMQFNDPDNLRLDAALLFVRHPGNAGITLGAIEFGGPASTLFTPQPIRTSRPAMETALQDNIRSDAPGGTNYNAAFTRANADNPDANGRLFLTDGEPTAGGPYADGHRGGGQPPTYVVGFGDATTTQANRDRLQRIADETGGRYFPQQTVATITPTFNEIGAILNCDRAPRTFTDEFSSAGQSRAHTVSLPRRTRRIDVVASWLKPDALFALRSIRAYRGRQLVGIARARRMRATRRSGRTFVSVRLTRIPRGARRLRFRVRASRLSASGDPAARRAITQVSANR